MVLPVVYENGQHRTGSMSELLSVSQSCGNYLSFGTDGGLYIDGNAILSNGEASNLLLISTVDQKVYLSEDTLIKAGFTKGSIDLSPSSLLSSDSGNLLVIGNDGKISLPVAALSGLSSGEAVTPATLISKEENNSLAIGSDGLFYVPSDCGVL